MRKLELFILGIFLIASGCASGGKLHESALLESKRLEIDKERGADICASFDIAMAESHVEFAMIELELGNYLQADTHLSLKNEHAEKAARNATSCFLKDRDGDGIPDEEDLCPDVPGTPELKGCPPVADRDGDGVPDSEDRCPDDKGPAELRGCPDRDGDGIPDIDDSCPDIPGIPEFKGCPPASDRDGDGVPDREDRCPDDKGPAELRGCPDRDGDGIPDIDDKCPGEPGPAELQGCPPASDRDGDGVPDSEDRCPDDKGPAELRGCPDRDGDGIPDIDDKCPDEPGPAELQGCPPVTDRDGDGIPDSEDRCPDEPGPVEFKGCPDRDGDGIPDIDDKCPDVPGVAEEQGCPKKYKLIVVTAQKIELKQIVLFQTGKTIIDRKSYAMLKEVADALKNASSVKKVIVEGHTDNVGSRGLNMSLSQKRAEAVREFLIDEGVAADKLEAKGFGPDKPVSSNRTAAGRAKNRRVEFVLEQ
ncbi:MAG: OmpA family protein [bacterium]